MTEEQVFLAALDLPDATARAAYLDETCGEDIAFRRQIEALLAAHFRSGEFLDVPAVKQVHAGSRDENTVAIAGAAVSAEKDHEDESDDLHFLTPSTRPDSLGRLGHYEMLQVLGRGGFGIVFRAFDDILQRVVAVKVMAPQIATLSPARKRFVREAQSSAKVRHENVVQVYEVGEQPLPYLAMEFIPGETLQQRLDRSGPLDVLEVLRIGRQIAEGLAAAHACDLIHRDIKPSNILLEGGAQKAKITDFGLARAADDASISQSGVIAGTPMFMSPEQALGQHIDQRADLFSLGSVLYQMASGRPPFRAPSALAVLKRVAEETPRPIPEIIPETPDWLCGIIAKLHAKKPEDRFQSAREVADLLADCEAKLKAKQEVRNVLPAARKPAGRKWVAAAAVLLLPVIALAVTEFAGVTHLFWGQQAANNPLDDVPGPTPPLVSTQKPLPPDHLFRGEVIYAQTFDDPKKPGAHVGGNQEQGWKSFVSDGSWVIEVEADRNIIITIPTDANRFALATRCRMDNLSMLWLGYRPVKAAGNAGFNLQLFGDGTWKLHAGRPSGAAGGIVLLSSSAAPAPEWTMGKWADITMVSAGAIVEIRVNGRLLVQAVDPELPTEGVYQDNLRGFQICPVATRDNAGRVEVDYLKMWRLPLDFHPDLEAKPLPPTFKNSMGMEFVKVPKGKSWLGGGKDKLGDQEVVIPADFYLGKYEVTQEEWEKVMGENPSHFSRTGEGKDAVKDISDADLKRFPVETVTWDQCQLFVEKLNRLEKETGWIYRLPKEAEWEYACRGGPMPDKLDSAFDFYFAKPTNTLLPEQANFNKRLNRSCKVGLYEANRLGLFDLHGNVLEWCDDAEKATGGASHRVRRGGGWDHPSADCLAALHLAIPPSDVSYSLGLRLARVPSSAPSPEVKTPPQ